MNGDFFEALSNPYRRQIVQMLKWKNHSVNEITAALGISQPSVSRHLDVLKHAGLVVCKFRFSGTAVTRERSGHSALNGAKHRSG